jgi:DNA-binding response OmpR family regulator
MKKATIIIIEDDADIREGIRILLESEHYKVFEAENGETGISLLNEYVDLVILDVMMPGMSGIRTCEEIRKFSFVPIIFLTAKSSDSDKLIGLMAGGDDYLAKPFSYSELLGRVKAQIRRYQIYRGKEKNGLDLPEHKLLEIGNIRINKDFNEVWVDDKEVELSELEYRILLLMMQHPRKVFSAQNLYESVWNEPYFHSSNGTVMVHISKLRVKIEKIHDSPTHIKTIWGKGYRFE